MTDVAGRRMTVEMDGDFVVFLIGARFNNKLQVIRSLVDLGGRRGMKHMLDHLVARPEKGLERWMEVEESNHGGWGRKRKLNVEF